MARPLWHTLSTIGLPRFAERVNRSLLGRSARRRSATSLDGSAGLAPRGDALRGSVRDLISVRAQLRKAVTEKRQQPLTETERGALHSALRNTEAALAALATLADLAGVRYPP